MNMSSESQLLYVDSDTESAAFHAEQLSSAYDFHVKTADSIATATAFLQINTIECVICVFELTDGNGFELLSHIRSYFGSIPVIILVDSNPREIDNDVFKSGTTELVSRSKIEESYEPLVERIRDLQSKSDSPSNSSETNESNKEGFEFEEPSHEDPLEKLYFGDFQFDQAVSVSESESSANTGEDTESTTTSPSISTNGSRISAEENTDSASVESPSSTTSLKNANEKSTSTTSDDVSEPAKSKPSTAENERGSMGSEVRESTNGDKNTAEENTASQSNELGESTNGGEISSEELSKLVSQRISSSDFSQQELQSLDKAELISILSDALEDDVDKHAADESAHSTSNEVTNYSRKKGSPSVNSNSETPSVNKTSSDGDVKESNEGPSSTEIADNETNRNRNIESEDSDRTREDIASESTNSQSRETKPDSERSTAGNTQNTKRLSDLDFSQGDTVLIKCSSQDSRKQTVHKDLLTNRTNQANNVLLIRYRSISQDTLRSIAANSENVTVFTIGCTQSVPSNLTETIETEEISDPNDVRRLGILATDKIKNWGQLNKQIDVSIDPLGVLFNYKKVEGIFRFLHVLLGKFSSEGAVTQVYVNPSAIGEQNSNTIKPLFDHAVTIDSEGVRLKRN